MAYLDKATYLLVDDQKQIAWKYASTWLIFDVISTIPSELARKISPKPFRSYGFFNMLRLWRLRRVSALFSRYRVFLNVAVDWKVHISCVLIVHDSVLTEWRKIGTITTFGFVVQSLFV